MRSHRETLILKPMDQYGGIGVLVGPFATQEDWDAQVDITREKNYVVQEYVNIPKEPLPIWDGGLKWEPKFVNVNFYAYNGRYAGGMARTSGEPVINISKGGGLIPIVVVEDY